ncbi:hypothetical protein ZIOFF_022320 [Zingiber officinale]|uniref:Uncharacterized protein n=1 Tax=Zingiber officinale TaxID=94328 RepID=A0A8J5LMN9_ZINOF|nr:hypothetical protein ZIOFF_022320 [Zingiber officinale]
MVLHLLKELIDRIIPSFWKFGKKGGKKRREERRKPRRDHDPLEGRGRGGTGLVGLLLQVVDDVLNVTRMSEELGKTTGKDLMKGKTTYPKLMGLDKAQLLEEQRVAKAEEEL